MGGRIMGNSNTPSTGGEHMDRATLRAPQASLKEKYLAAPDSGMVRAHAAAHLDAAGACSVPTWAGLAQAGLHPATGGVGSKACAADMLLQALVACAGVTLANVAIAMGVTLRNAAVRAEGTWDARGTLAVTRGVPVGLTSVALHFELDTDAEPVKQQRLIELTERYCVVYQTLRQPPQMSAALDC
jgi:uncharacterized OsmC-like protein